MHRNPRLLFRRSISFCSIFHNSTSEPSHFNRLLIPISSSRPIWYQYNAEPFCGVVPSTCSLKCFSSIGEPVDYNKEVDEINLKFVEAREEIEAAMESKETVYFDEEADCARDAVKVVLDMFNGLLARLPEKERMTLQRSMGLKIEQLKAELKQLED